MKIHYAGVKIEDDKLLSSYKMVQGSSTKLIQTKCDNNEIPGLIVSYEQDPISLEDKTARMPCGHVIGRDCMTQFIRSLVNCHLFTITCPSYKPNGERCSCEWDYALCRKIGVFTKEEILQFETGLSKNWIIQNTIECPNCQQNLYKGGLQIDRVRCPRCRYGDFCACCLKKWLNKDNNLCGNKDCLIIDSFLEKSPWTKNFDLKQSNNQTIKVKCPMHRACPKCTTVIEHEGGCKHMKCKNCETNFCWVCLGLKQNNTWACGSFTTYCGTIAQAQVVVGNRSA